jgi:hypothetical protein
MFSGIKILSVYELKFQGFEVSEFQGIKFSRLFIFSWFPGFQESLF